MPRNSIHLHRKYGLNPTMPVCFFCKRETGEVALLGAAYRDEAPMRMILDKTPCRQCQEDWAKGIALIEVTGDERAPEPTGRFIVMTREWLERVIEPPETRDAVLKAGKSFMDVATFSVLAEAAKEGTDETSV